MCGLSNGAISSDLGGGMAEWLASPDWDREVMTRGFESPVSQEVMGSDGMCKYLSCLSLILC